MLDWKQGSKSKVSIGPGLVMRLGLALFFCAPFFSICFAANSVVNPSMESSLLSSWSTYGNDLNNSTGWATDAYYAGSHSLKIINTTGANSGWRGAEVKFSSPYPKSLTLGGYSKAKNVSLGVKGLYSLDFYIQFEDGSSTWYVNNLIFSAGTHNWEKREASVTFTKGIKLIRPYCLLYYGAKGTVWFDSLYAYANPPQCENFSSQKNIISLEAPVELTASFSDPNGWQNIYYILLLANTSINGNNSLYCLYNQNTNKLYLRNDANTAWLGGFSPGANNIIENANAKINCLNSRVTGSGNELTVTLQLSFKQPLSGARNVYLYAVDDSSNIDGWKQKGELCIIREPLLPQE